jgi:hypothetical protein
MLHREIFLDYKWVGLSSGSLDIAKIITLIAYYKVILRRIITMAGQCGGYQRLLRNNSSSLTVRILEEIFAGNSSMAA